MKYLIRTKKSFLDVLKPGKEIRQSYNLEFGDEIKNIRLHVFFYIRKKFIRK